METTKWIRRNDKFKFSRDRESSYRCKRIFYSGGYRTFLLQRNLVCPRGTKTWIHFPLSNPRSSANNEEERQREIKKKERYDLYRNKTRYAHSFRDYLSRVLPRLEWQSSIGRSSIPFADIPYIRGSQRAVQRRKP